jgi:hypothetical protein
MDNQQTITITDLEGLRSIIDLACTRGAFRAEEMQQVGELYNKLTGFLQAVVAQAQAQQPDESKGETNE